MKTYSRDRAASPARVRIEAAERILMGARHVSEEQSFDELLDVATRHQLDLVHLAEAFTEVADGTDSMHCAAELGDTRAVVVEEWGLLMTPSRTRSTPMVRG